MKAGKKIKVILYGVGPIGQRATKVALGREDIQLVGAIDIDPDKVGRDLAEILDLNTHTGIKISDNPRLSLRNKIQQ